MSKAITKELIEQQLIKDSSKEVSLPSIELPVIEVNSVRLRIVGDSSLIVHRFDDKTRKEMEDKQARKAKQGREARDPEQEFKDSLYLTSDGKLGFPASAFKNAMVDACRFVQDVTMVGARGAFHVMEDRDGLVLIDGEPRMRTDIVRVGGRGKGTGTATPRYRGEVFPWSADLTIRWNTRAISIAQITNLLNVAGFGVGIGEWRPEKNGSYGMFHVEGGFTS